MGNIQIVVHAGVLVAQWPPVPPEAVGWMLPELDSLAGDITAAILREVPEYDKPDDDSYALIVHQVAREAVRHFAARLAEPAQAEVAEAAARMFHDIGRVEAAAGRSLGALHAALRVGMRVTWQRLRERTPHEGGDAGMVARVGEAIFCYLEELSAACSAGYTEAKAEFAGEAERLRRRLLDVLVSEPPPPPEAISSLARAAGWRLPRRVALVALVLPAGADPGPLPAEVLSGLSRRDPYLLVPDPDGPGRRQLLEAGLRKWRGRGPEAKTRAARDVSGAGLRAAVGPAVPLGQAAASLRWARRALALAQRGQVPSAGGITYCDDHLATLLLLADAELAGILGDQALAPLRRLRPEQADRLAQTLLAWLESADNAGVAASRLHVHPQTVRYRLRQLTELFGDRLGDPEARFTLQVALRARRLTGDAAPPG